MIGRGDRRRFLVRGAQAGALLLLTGCDRLSRSEWVTRLLSSAESATYRVQRAVMPRRALAREFAASDVSPIFPTNGTTSPNNPAYHAMAARAFTDWRLVIDGLVERPARLSLSDLRALPSRTQITRHDCVEGWSAIAKWKGTLLGPVLDRVGRKPGARYVVFHCADPMDEAGSRYYESIDLDDAYHPQTLLAYELNDRVLPVEYGAPIRLRLERQLGYKMAKYVMRIELVNTLAGIGGGHGGYWEDQGYEWYAGI